MNIPDEAVEAAAVALRSNPHLSIHMDRVAMGLARTALEAAAPHLTAGVCRISWVKGWRCALSQHKGGPCALVPQWWNLADKWRYRNAPPNPYRSAGAGE